MSPLPALGEPIVGAPLAGGPSTVALAAAVSEAGGLGFLAAGYRTPEAVAEDVAALRARTARPFGVNVFAPPGPPADAAAVAAYAATIEGGPLGEPRHDDDGYAAKLDVLEREAVPVVSFTFGCPQAATVGRLRRVGSSVWVTVTTPAEALMALAAGADALVVQGVEAGGHRGTFDDDGRGDLGLLALLQLVRARAGDTPLIASGGIATGQAVAAVLAAGASAAQIGTAFLRCPEAGTVPAHRAALADRDAPTALTRAFTGREARGIENPFMRAHPDAPRAYPDVHHVTAPLRKAARERGDGDTINLWAGQAFALSEDGVPAGELVARLGREARAALAAAAAAW
ncbi:MAG TPA: nitronate monooxygenase [Solirubrobacteraceae bacterium]